MLILPYVSHKRLISYIIMSLIGFTMLGIYVIVLTWCTTLGFPEYRGNGIPVYRREKPPDNPLHYHETNQLNVQRLHRDLKYSKSSSDMKITNLGAKSTDFQLKNSNNVNFVVKEDDTTIYSDDDSVDKNIDNTSDSLHIPSSLSSSSSTDKLSSRNPNDPKHRDSMIKRLPQAIIIGVKKGGTRALLEFLRIHPDVRAPGPEPHFFDRHYDKGLDWYRNQMPSTLPGQLTIEKTPSYFVTREVPQRIYNMSKTIKLIVVVRDPVTRAISDYTQAATKRPGLKPFDQMAFIDNSSRIVDTKWAAVRIGVYAKHLERWLKYFPLGQIHFVNGEKLISDPAGEMAKVQDFLSLKRIVTDKHFYLNETRGFPCLKKPEGSGRPHCLGKTKGRQHPRVDLNVMQRLRDFFKPFNAKFYQITGQVFDWN